MIKFLDLYKINERFRAKFAEQFRLNGVHYVKRYGYGYANGDGGYYEDEETLPKGLKKIFGGKQRNVG